MLHWLAFEDEELTPDEAEEGNLVLQLQFGEERDGARPLDGAEEDARGELADGLDDHGAARLETTGCSGRAGTALPAAAG